MATRHLDLRNGSLLLSLMQDRLRGDHLGQLWLYARLVVTFDARSSGYSWPFCLICKPEVVIFLVFGGKYFTGMIAKMLIHVANSDVQGTCTLYMLLLQFIE